MTVDCLARTWYSPGNELDLKQKQGKALTDRLRDPVLLLIGFGIEIEQGVNGLEVFLLGILEFLVQFLSLGHESGPGWGQGIVHLCGEDGKEYVPLVLVAEHFVEPREGLEHGGGCADPHLEYFPESHQFLLVGGELAKPVSLNGPEFCPGDQWLEGAPPQVENHQPVFLNPVVPHLFGANSMHATPAPRLHHDNVANGQPVEVLRESGSNHGLQLDDAVQAAAAAEVGEKGPGDAMEDGRGEGPAPLVAEEDSADEGLQEDEAKGEGAERPLERQASTASEDSLESGGVLLELAVFVPLAVHFGVGLEARDLEEEFASSDAVLEDDVFGDREDAPGYGMGEVNFLGFGCH